VQVVEEVSGIADVTVWIEPSGCGIGVCMSRAAFYWSGWLLLVAVVIGLRFAPAGLRPEISGVSLALGYVAIVSIGIMLVNFAEGRRLLGYLEQAHRSKWEYVTHVPFFGPGGVNSFRTLAFVFSRDDLEDERVGELKSSYRRVLALVLSAFVSIPVVFIALARG
jgi:hypothetical protein